VILHHDDDDVIKWSDAVWHLAFGGLGRQCWQHRERCREQFDSRFHLIPLAMKRDLRNRDPTHQRNLDTLPDKKVKR